LPGMRSGRLWLHGRRTVHGHPRSPHFSMGYIGIVQHKEHSPEVLSIPPGTPCVYINKFIDYFDSDRRLYSVVTYMVILSY